MHPSERRHRVIEAGPERRFVANVGHGDVPLRRSVEDGDEDALGCDR